jgi:hypothetical protein
VLNDSSGTSASTYTFDQGNRFFKTFAPAMFTVVRSGFEQTILNANGGNNTITVDRTTSALTILSNAGNDTVNVLDSTEPVTVNTGAETIGGTTAPFGDSIAINTDFSVAGDTPATVIVDESDAMLGLTVAQNGTLQITQGAVIDKLVGSGSAFAIFGTIDLASGALLSRVGGPAPTFFRPLLTRGFNAGGWNGTSTSGAINSSLAAGSPLPDAVGYGLGSEIGISSIAGFSIAPGDVLLRYTWYGDADLNGKVDGADYARIDSKFNQQATLGNIGGWVNGDFDYNNKLDGADYALIDAAFNSQGSPLRPGNGHRRGRFA